MSDTSTFALPSNGAASIRGTLDGDGIAPPSKRETIEGDQGSRGTGSPALMPGAIPRFGRRLDTRVRGAVELYLL